MQQNHQHDSPRPTEGANSPPREAKLIKAEAAPSWRRKTGRHLPYAGILSFLGTVIVLGTFVVKDVLKDQQKDLLASLEAANTTWALRQNVNDIIARINTLTTMVGAVWNLESAQVKSGRIPKKCNTIPPKEHPARGAGVFSAPSRSLVL
jgi:hypothetical protein